MFYFFRTYDSGAVFGARHYCHIVFVCSWAKSAHVIGLIAKVYEQKKGKLFGSIGIDPNNLPF
jgi:hypothetical protein